MRILFKKCLLPALLFLLASVARGENEVDGSGESHNDGSAKVEHKIEWYGLFNEMRLSNPCWQKCLDKQKEAECNKEKGAKRKDNKFHAQTDVLCLDRFEEGIAVSDNFSKLENLVSDYSSQGFWGLDKDEWKARLRIEYRVTNNILPYIDAIYNDNKKVLDSTSTKEKPSSTLFLVGTKIEF